MKNLIKAFVAVLVCSLVIIACDKDDDPITTKLTSISYAKNSVEVTKAAALTGTAIKVLPSDAKATFVIKSITLNAKSFTNPTGGFKIATDGKISLAKGNKLATGKYILTVQATDKFNKKIIKTTTYTITIK
jgi:5-hydroxyisourate hydrolase-like protein (transthyretin family)